jgi:urease accessory protein
MTRSAATRVLATAAWLLPTAALAHPGHGEGLAAGLAHPIGGADHVAAMVAVGLWAALVGGRALWLWPASFVAMMLAGAGLGMAHLPLPYVEAGVIASVVVLGLLVAFAVDMAVVPGALLVGGFALFHGYAHGLEMPETAGGLGYLAGFTLATALLHGVGIGVARSLRAARLQPLVRAAGAACLVLGAVLAAHAI